MQLDFTFSDIQLVAIFIAFSILLFLVNLPYVITEIEYMEENWKKGDSKGMIVAMGLCWISFFVSLITIIVRLLIQQ